MKQLAWNAAQTLFVFSILGAIGVWGCTKKSDDGGGDAGGDAGAAAPSTTVESGENPEANDDGGGGGSTDASGGSSSDGGGDDGTSDPCDPDITAPAAPTDLILSGIARPRAAMDLSWTAGTDACAFGSYEYSIGTTEGGEEVLGWTDIGDVTTHQESAGIASDLSEGTDYFISLRSKDASGNLSDTVHSASWQITLYTSCYDHLNQNPHIAGDGVYLIDTDGIGGNASYSVYCDMTFDSGGWTRLSNQEMIATNLYADEAAASLSNPGDPESNLYSILSRTAEFQRDGRYEFLLRWPGGTCDPTPHHWRQDESPMDISNGSAIVGYESISTPTNQGGGGWTGLCLADHLSNALLNGNCSHSNWFYAVGEISLWGGGAPACNGSAHQHVELLVR